MLYAGSAMGNKQSTARVVPNHGMEAAVDLVRRVFPARPRDRRPCPCHRPHWLMAGMIDTASYLGF